MTKDTIIRAWKDPSYRASLTDEERAQLPDCPSGVPFTELGDDSLAEVVGGAINPTISRCMERGCTGQCTSLCG